MFGKTTIMRLLQNLINFNFAELIKYDFESIDIEVSAENGKILKDTIKYTDLLPSDEKIEEYIKNSDIYKNDLRNTWDIYKDDVSPEEKISCFDDDSMSDEEKIEFWNEYDFNIANDYIENGNFNIVTNDVLIDLKDKNKFKEIIRKIIKEEEISNLYYEEYINELDYDSKYQCYSFDKTSGFDVSYNWSYRDVKETVENIINAIKVFVENQLSLYKEIDFINKKNIIRIIKIIKKDYINKTVNILDMTKVYNFANELLTSSLITNKLLEWKSDLPAYCYDRKNFSLNLEQKVYDMVLKEFEDEICIYYDYSDKKTKIDSSCGEYEVKSKDISELNSSNTIEINSILNHYFYSEDFILNINRKSLEYYKKYNDMKWFITSEKSMIEDKMKIKDRFIKYIRPIILKNSPFDIDWWKEKNVKEKMFIDFCTQEWQLFKENVNPKIKILQELLDKYMMNKNVEVTPMGLLIKSKDDNRKIPLNSLSSGEKKLIVIFMHCLFNEDVPIIIDEPEISLSIIWQENLLPDLLEKTNIKQIIVATHSSAVISNSILDKYIIPLPNSIVERSEEDNE